LALLARKAPSIGRSAGIRLAVAFPIIPEASSSAPAIIAIRWGSSMIFTAMSGMPWLSSWSALENAHRARLDAEPIGA
jgi:hypothetical protein